MVDVDYPGHLLEHAVKLLPLPVILFAVLFAGGAPATAMRDVIETLLSDGKGLIGAALNGEPAALFALAILILVVVLVQIVIPGRRELFRIFWNR
ncbi:hypothetical protein [Halorhabdus salina]|uniref:hypothetical protein n=1 Tax=Halorhabdus salina TaxID=2750670 RepID=UPI0015EEB80E|nr:hypothetical protein [Halorhabdus salina]